MQIAVVGLSDIQEPSRPSTAQTVGGAFQQVVDDFVDMSANRQSGSLLSSPPRPTLGIALPSADLLSLAGEPPVAASVPGATPGDAPVASQAISMVQTARGADAVTAAEAVDNPSASPAEERPAVPVVQAAGAKAGSQASAANPKPIDPTAPEAVQVFKKPELLTLPVAQSVVSVFGTSDGPPPVQSTRRPRDDAGAVEDEPPPAGTEATSTSVVVAMPPPLVAKVIAIEVSTPVNAGSVVPAGTGGSSGARSSGDQASGSLPGLAPAVLPASAPVDAARDAGRLRTAAAAGFDAARVDAFATAIVQASSAGQQVTRDEQLASVVRSPRDSHAGEGDLAASDDPARTILASEAAPPQTAAAALPVRQNLGDSGDKVVVPAERSTRITSPVRADSPPDPSLSPPGSAAPVPAASPSDSLPLGVDDQAVPARASGAPMAYRPAYLAADTGAAIVRHIANSGGPLTIRIDPPDFGTINVRVAYEDGALRAVVGSDSTAVLSLLSRDVAELTRAVSEAGVSTDQRSFRFEANSGNTDSSRMSGDSQPRGQRQPQGRAHGAGVPQEDNDGASFQPLRWRGLIDVAA